MAVAGTGRRQPSIRTLWAIAKSPELGMTDEDLHAVVYRETGKESIRALTQGQISEVVRVLQNMKDGARGITRAKRTDEGGDARTIQQRRKIYALTASLGWNDNPQRIQAFAKRMTGMDRLEWLSAAQCRKVIEGLKAMQSRQEQAGRVCPQCGRRYTEPPALPRTDNATDICPACGLKEALAAMPPVGSDGPDSAAGGRV